MLALRIDITIRQLRSPFNCYIHQICKIRKIYSYELRGRYWQKDLVKKEGWLKNKDWRAENCHMAFLMFRIFRQVPHANTLVDWHFYIVARKLVYLASILGDFPLSETCYNIPLIRLCIGLMRKEGIPLWLIQVIVDIRGNLPLTSFLSR